MKIKTISIIVAIIAIIIAIFCYQQRQIKEYKERFELYHDNTMSLLQDVTKYKTRDSLNGARVKTLTLELAEYKQTRPQEMQLIGTLDMKGRDIENVTTTQTTTEAPLTGRITDTIVIHNVHTDSIYTYQVDTLQSLNIYNRWYELHGTIEEGIFNGRFINRDSLMVVASGKPKRFLGFLWRTGKIKDRRVDVVSRNPYTNIEGVEYIEIKP